VLVMDAGRLVADGAPGEALSSEVLGRVFGVQRSAERQLIRGPR